MDKSLLEEGVIFEGDTEDALKFTELSQNQQT